DPARRHAFAHRVLGDLFTIVRTLAQRYSVQHVARLFPAEYADLLRELLHEPSRGPEYVDALLQPLLREGRDRHLIRLIVRLVRAGYGDDPAECFVPRGTGLRDPQVMARMQKAAAVMQWKLEGQTIARHPEWRMDHRRLLRALDPARGTIEIDGAAHPLRDRH